MLMLLWASIYALLSSDVMEQQVSRHWDIVKDLVPSEEYDASAPRDQQVAQTAEFLQSHIEIVGGAGLFALAIYIVAIAAAGLIINRPVLISTTFTVLNYFGIVIGLGIAIIGAIFLSRSAAGYLSLGGAVLGIGGFLFLTSIVGLWGIRQKDVPKISFSTGMSFVALLAFGVGCWLGFNNAGACVPAAIVREDVCPRSEKEEEEKKHASGTFSSRFEHPPLSNAEETAAKLDDLSDADMAALQVRAGKRRPTSKALRNRDDAASDRDPSPASSLPRHDAVKPRHVLAVSVRDDPIHSRPNVPGGPRVPRWGLHHGASQRRAHPSTSKTRRRASSIP